MKRIRLPDTLKDEEMVDIQEFVSQINSISILPTLQQPKKRKSLKTASFNPSEEKPHKNKEKKITFDESQESPERDAIITTTQGDQTASMMLHSKFLRSSRLKQSLENRRRKKYRQLKDVITTQKVNIIKQAFIQKLKRNNVYSQPVYLDLYGEKRTELWDRKGFELKESYQKIFSLVIMINILFSIFIYSLAMVFQDFENRPIIKAIQIMSILGFLLEIIINLTTVRFSLGRKLQTYRDIREGYKREGFYLDIANFMIAFINIVSYYPPLTSLRLVTLFKFPDCMQKLQKLQVYFIENYYYEQYWSLIKVLLFNFCFAHILSIILLQMANLNHQQNWMITEQIQHAEWYQQYIWAYYWGTTVMLTIGFGDIVPVNYQEACCMILIETISCVVLSYNISCVGALISNIRSQDNERGKNLKIFKKLADKNHINQDLTWKINNYIEEHANIKKLFNIQEEVQFVEKLPTAYRVDYLKQANKTVFQNLIFFNNMMQKTLFSLAQKIETRISHPQELILNAQHSFDLLILKNGEVGFISRKSNLKYSNLIIDTITVKQNDKPFLLHANFIIKDKSPFRLKSIIYSVIYSLNYASLIDILKDSNLDFEMYCQLRDKSKHKLDEFQVFPCKYCKTRHTKFLCPKLHFMPLKKHVIDRYLSNQKNDCNERITIFQRDRPSKQSCLIKYLQNSQIYQRKINEEKQSVAHKNIIKERYVLDELKPLQNGTPTQQHRDKQIQAISKMQIQFLENTTQLMKNYASKMFGAQIGQDQIWQVDADRMKNYRHYFCNDNSCNLQQKFDVDNRKKTFFQNQAQQAEMHLYQHAKEHVEQQDNSICETIGHMTSLEINFEIVNLKDSKK